MTRHARANRWSVVRLLPAAVVALCVIGWPHPAVAQTRFAWPAATVDVGRYATIEECIAATLRVRDSLADRSMVWRDTMPWDPAEAREPVPAPVSATADRCGVRFRPDSASLDDFAPLLDLYLYAGRDVDAEALVRRRLAAIPAKADSQRAAVLDSVADRYLDAQPRRLALAEPIIEQLVRSKAIAPEAKLLRVFLLGRFGKEAGDTALVHRAARGVLALVETLTDVQKRSFDSYVKALTFNALRQLHHAEAMDSLRRGTPGYTALARAAWAKASGESPQAMRTPIGLPAPRLEGDFWFEDTVGSATPAARTPVPPPTPVRPSPGRISLVVYAPDGPCLEPGSSCWQDYAVLRRLARRFPELEVTVVSKTRGYFWRLEPPTPAEEAKAMQKVWTEVHRLPGTYVVKETAFWRLPGLDRRRINRDDPNETHYSFGKTFDVYHLTRWYVLVDRDGIVVDAGGTLQRIYEAELAERIDILLHRNGSGKGA